jgi:hypothetical protein
MVPCSRHPWADSLTQGDPEDATAEYSDDDVPMAMAPAPDSTQPTAAAALPGGNDPAPSAPSVGPGALAPRPSGILDPSALLSDLDWMVGGRLAWCGEVWMHWPGCAGSVHRTLPGLVHFVCVQTRLCLHFVRLFLVPTETRIRTWRPGWLCATCVK